MAHPIEKTLNTVEKEIYEERAAIYEYDGNLTKNQAEVIAARQILDLRQEKHDRNHR